AALHGLVPFLGPEGIVLLATGRYDRYDVEPGKPPESALENPLERALKSWFSGTSASLGYGIWEGERGSRPHRRHWWVLLHAPETMFWKGQWMPVVPDLGYRAGPTETVAQSGAHPVSDTAPADVVPFTAVPAAASDR